MLMQYKGVTEFAFFNAPRQRIVVNPGDVVDINDSVAVNLQQLYPSTWQPFTAFNFASAAIAAAVNVEDAPVVGEEIVAIEGSDAPVKPDEATGAAPVEPPAKPDGKKTGK